MEENAFSSSGNQHHSETSLPDEGEAVVGISLSTAAEGHDKAQAEAKTTPTEEPLPERPTLDVPGPKDVKDVLVKLQKYASDEFQKKHGFKGASGNKLARWKYRDFQIIFADFQENAPLEALHMYQGRSMSASEQGIRDGVSGPKAVLWIHGLRDNGDDHLLRGALTSKVLGAQWHAPTAPARAVTCNKGAQTTSWFDILSMPVTVSEPENPKDFDVSVESVHNMLLGIESDGALPGDIILGGFSQGAAVSLQAGLSYSKTLAGVLSIGGWCPNRSDVSAWMSPAGRETPVLMSFGNGDPDIDIGVTRQSSDRLAAVLGDKIEVRCSQRRRHEPDQSEIRAAITFIKKSLGL